MTLPPTAFPLIAFDLDGTLVDSESSSIPDLAAFLAEEYHVPVTANDWYKPGGYHGLAGKALLSRIEQDFGVSIHFESFMAARQHRLVSLFQRVGLTSAPGVTDVLQQLANQPHILCVASNSSHSRIATSFNYATPSFNNVFKNNYFSAVDKVGKTKPAPDIYLAVAKHFNIPPQHCLAVEDSPSGATAALNAGFQVIGYTGLSRHPQRTQTELTTAGVQHIITHWNEFLPLLNSLKNNIS